MSSPQPKSGTHPSTKSKPADVKPRPVDTNGSDPGPALQGEGNITAGRRYNQATRDFVASGQVAQKAREAAPKTAQEGDSLQRAEAEGRKHAKR